MQGRESMFIFQQHAGFSPVSSVAKADVPALEETLKDQKVQSLLKTNGIDTSKLSPRESTTAIVALMKKELDLESEKRVFTKEWQKLTNLDLAQMEALLVEYERLHRMVNFSDKIVTDPYKTGILADLSIRRTNQDQDYSAALATKLADQYADKTAVETQVESTSPLSNKTLSDKEAAKLLKGLKIERT